MVRAELTDYNNANTAKGCIQGMSAQEDCYSEAYGRPSSTFSRSVQPFYTDVQEFDTSNITLTPVRSKSEEVSGVEMSFYSEDTPITSSIR